jgi:hypothetical protein
MFHRTTVSRILKESLVIMLVGAVLGGFLNRGLIRSSMNGELLTRIEQKQTSDFENKVLGEGYPGWSETGHPVESSR